MNKNNNISTNLISTDNNNNSYSTCSSSNHTNKKKWDIIKTNNGKQRISQACDRCCIKKIKCDGLPGGCSNCIKVGFFCKITDKLTRSSFPKGYTKALEKQIVDLELENKRIKLQLEEINASNNDTKKDTTNDEHTITTTATDGGNLINFVNSIVADNNDNDDDDNDDNTNDKSNVMMTKLCNDNNSSTLDIDDDFFNFEKHLQPRQKLNGDLLSFDQFKTNPLIECLSHDFNLPLPITLLDISPKSHHHNDDVDNFDDFNQLVKVYIQPLLHKDTNLMSNSIFNNNKIDKLISKFFNHFNKLIPILDFKKFYNQYLNFFNKFDIEKPGAVFEYDQDDKIFIIKLLLIIKFSFNTSSIFNNDSHHFNYKIFKFIHFQKLIQHVNFMKPDVNKFELMLMLLNYLYNFEIPKLEFNSFDPKLMNEWCYELLSMSLHYINTLGLNINNDELIVDIEDQELLIHHNFIRLKLYWSFRILLRSIKIKFNYNYKNLKLIKEDFEPSLLENVTVLENDLQYTIEYLKLIKIIPINFTQLLDFEMVNIKQELLNWKLNFDEKFDLSTKLSKELLSIYYHYKFMLNKNCHQEIIENSFQILNLLLKYENKPKVSRGRKKKRSFDEMLQNDEVEMNINLIQHINSLSDYEKLMINEKLSLLNNNFKTVLLISCLYNGLSNTFNDKVDKICQIFEIGLVEKTPFEKAVLDRIKNDLLKAKSIDVSQELNELHQSFTIHQEEYSISSPSSSSSSSSVYSNQSQAFDMSRNSSITTSTSFKMSRTPSLQQEQKGDKIEVESLFGGDNYNRINYYKDPTTRQMSQFMYKDDEDLARLKATVLSLR